LVGDFGLDGSPLFKHATACAYRGG